MKRGDLKKLLSRDDDTIEDKKIIANKEKEWLKDQGWKPVTKLEAHYYWVIIRNGISVQLTRDQAVDTMRREIKSRLWREDYD